MLERRELLSTFQLEQVRVIWNGPQAGKTTLVFDPSGALVNTHGTEPAQHPGGQLAGGASPLRQIIFKFTEAVDPTSIDLSDVQITNNPALANPFRPAGPGSLRAARPWKLRVPMTGTLADSGFDHSIDIALGGIRSAGFVPTWMDPWTGHFAVTGTSPPPPPPPTAVVPPSLRAIAPGDGAVLRSAPDSIRVTFSQDMAAGSIGAGTITLVRSGGDRTFSDGNEIAITPASVGFDPSTNTASFLVGSFAPSDLYRISVQGATNLDGVLLDGDRDGAPGGAFTSTFLIDSEPPTVTLGLGAGSDSGVPKDNRTNRPGGVVFGGTVSDSSAAIPSGYRVQLELGNDGLFDDGEATTDRVGAYVITAPAGSSVANNQTVQVRVTDLAGNTSTASVAVSVDITPPHVLFDAPIDSFDASPATLIFKFTEPMNPAPVEDLKNYNLYGSGGDGVFFNRTMPDFSQYLTAARYDALQNQVTLTLAPNLPNDSYRLVVRSGGTLEDIAGNRLAEDGLLDVRVGGVTRTSLPRPVGAQPLDPHAITQFPDYHFPSYETAGPNAAVQEQTIVRRTFHAVNPNAVLAVSELEPPVGPASNNSLGACEGLGANTFGQDPGESPDLVLSGVDFGAQDQDFYCFTAHAGEVVKFSLTDSFGFILPTLPTLTIWDLGSDGKPGGTGEAADHPLITNGPFQFFIFNSRPVFFLSDLVPDFVQVMITGITGSAMANPDDQGAHPLGSESRQPQDRTYVLQVDTGAALPYLVQGEFQKPFSTASGLEQIIFVDFDGAKGVTGFEDSTLFQNPITVDVPPFDVGEYGFDPSFQDQFIDSFMGKVRENLERVRAQNINTGQNGGFGIQPFSFELEDSRHFPDPGNGPNVTRIIVGGTASIADLPLGVIGIAEDVDTGNVDGSNNVLVFSHDLANFELSGVAPVGFGPGRLQDLTNQLAEVASHEVGHVLGLWHTRAEGLETLTCAPSPCPTNVFGIPADFDNIIDPIVAPLGINPVHRFDHFRDSDLFFFGQFIALEAFDGVADSVGTLAWGMTGTDNTAPRVLGLTVAPGQIKVRFSEAMSLASMTTVLGAATITLDLVDPLTGLTTPVPLDAITPSAFDPLSDTLTLSVTGGAAAVVPGSYRLTLLSPFAGLAVTDKAGVRLDGEFPGRTSPQSESFPSGDGQPGGSFVLNFLVSPQIAVDADGAAGGVGSMESPVRSIQAALNLSQYAGLGNAPNQPVTVRVAPASFAYTVPDAGPDNIIGTGDDLGAIIIPDNVSLVFDGTSDGFETLFVSDVLGKIHRIDGNTGIELGSFNAPLPLGDQQALAFDGASLYFLSPGVSGAVSTIRVLDPITGVVRRSFTAPSTTTGITALAFGNGTLYALDAGGHKLFLIDPTNGSVKTTLTLDASLDLGGGLEFDATANLLYATTSASAVLLELDPRSGKLLGTIETSVAGADFGDTGVVGTQLFAADRVTGQIFRIDPATGLALGSFASPGGTPAALAGAPAPGYVVKLLGSRIDVAGVNASLVVRGTPDQPVVFTSLRDDTFFGDTGRDGKTVGAPGDWMGIAFRNDSDDFTSHIENAVIRYAGGKGLLRPGLTTTLNAITLFDARPTVLNTEISSNAQSAIGATPDSFERSQGLNGPDLFWNVDPGVPAVGHFNSPTITDLGVFETLTGHWFIDLNGNHQVDPGEGDIVFGKPNDTPVVGDWDGDGIDQLGVFDRHTGTWTLDLDNSRSENSADTIFDFGQDGDLPILGRWNNDTVTDVGVLRPSTNEVFLDLNGDHFLQVSEDVNGNGVLDAGEDLNGNGTLDLNEGPFKFLLPNQTLVIGDWDGDGVDQLGSYTPGASEWRLDLDNNYTFDVSEDVNRNGKLDANEDKNANGVLDINDGPFLFGSSGSVPAVGDWDGDGITQLGVFKPSTGQWQLDLNNNRKLDTTGEGPFLFGGANDTPVVGDWNGDGSDDIGTTRTAITPLAGSTTKRFVPRQWLLDLVPTEDVNGNGRLDAGEDLNGNRVLDKVYTYQPSEDLNGNGKLDPAEDSNGNGRLDAGEDLNGNGKLDPKEDVNGNGVLDLNDGPFTFSSAVRGSIDDFVFNNSLNSVWVFPGFQTVSDAIWDDVALPHVLTGSVEVQAIVPASIAPTLTLQPGLVLKMGLANLNVSGFGATLLADSDLKAGDPRVVFTSLNDDTRGPFGRPQDTNNDKGLIAPLPGDWGGVVIGTGATAIINGSEFQYGGNLRVPFRNVTFVNSIFQNGLISPNPITLDGGPIFATITNNIIANTNNLANTSARARPSDMAAIGVVGLDALGPGPNLPRIPFNANPFIRANDVSTNNGLNGLEVRTDAVQAAFDPNFTEVTVNNFLNQDGVWDDTDITHILLGTVNWDTFGAADCFIFQQFGFNIPCSITLTLRSNPIGTFDAFDGVKNSPPESLVIKLGGRFNTQFTQLAPNPAAGPVITVGAGFQLGWDDGNGNTPFQNFPIDSGADSILVVEGIPGNEDTSARRTPVILTSLRDDTAGPRGPQDTNNDGSNTAPAGGDWGGVVVGAWARTFGGVSPINGAPLSASHVRDADIRFASTGVLMQSNSLEVSNSAIRSSRDFGVHALQGPNLPNVPGLGLFNAAGVPRDPAQGQVWNSVLVSNGTGIEQSGGPDNQNFLLESHVPRSIFLNNTLHANGTAINIVNRSGPMVMNNAITGTGNAGTGILVDASSLNLRFEIPPQHEMPLLLRNLFFGLANNGRTGSIPRGLGGQEIIGLDPGYTDSTTFDFTPSQNSPLVDQAISEYISPSDPFFQFFDPLWGPVIAPPRDQVGVFRRDNFANNFVGGGTKPWYDIGALERVDVVSSIIHVVDMDPKPLSTFDNTAKPGSVLVTFSEPALNVDEITFTILASGKAPGTNQGDGNFTNGNEVTIAGIVREVPGSSGTQWVFTPTVPFPSDEAFQVTVKADGPFHITALDGTALDGEGPDKLPSGNGVPGGDFIAHFTIGDALPANTNVFFVDDNAVAPFVGTSQQPFQNINQAIAAAVAGDLIFVRPGVYRQPIVMNKRVTLESTDGAITGFATETCTCIEVTTGAPAILVQNLLGGRIGSTRNGKNHGFFITTTAATGQSSTAQGIGIQVQGSAIDIEANFLISNTIGIQANSGAGTGGMPRIVNNLITGNSIAGIDITSQVDAAIANVVNNTISFNQEGVVVRSDANPRVAANIINNIVSSNVNSGVNVQIKAAPVIQHNDAWGNSGSNFAGNKANLPEGSRDTDGNISFNPLFVNPLNPLSLADRANFIRFANFALQSASPAIDAGLDRDPITDLPIAPPRDIKGVTRNIDIPGVNDSPTPSNTTPHDVDMGAFEFVPGSVGAAFGVRSAASTAAPAVDAVLAGSTVSAPLADALLDDWNSIVSELLD